MLQQFPHQGGDHRRLANSTTEPPTIGGDYYPSQQGGFTNFQPSLAVVLGVLTVMFSLTFALLIYAKCCHRDPAATARRNRLRSAVFSSASIDSIRSSGLSKKAIESLPFFRFGTLRGSKDGLECAVCLSKYDDAEILRLLPKCRHAFHIDCVDRWLAGNSTCPLCRSSVAAEDASLLNTSSRSIPASSIREDPDTNSVDLNPNSIENEGIDVFVEREEEEGGDQDRVVRRSASIFSIGSSFRRLFTGESGIPVADAASGGGKAALHKHNHKIVVSDVVFKNRWSNVSSSDLMFLKSEMMFSSDRFSASARSNRDRSAAAARSLGYGEIAQSIEDEIEKKRCVERRAIEFVKRDSNDSSSSPTRAFLNPSSSGSGGGGNSPTLEGRRTMSEITVLSRFRELGWRNYRGRENPESEGVIGGGEEAVEEKKRKKWLPIARKTVEWLASREETECSGSRQGLNFV